MTIPVTIPYTEFAPMIFFFFENGFNPSPSPPKTAAVTFSFLLLSSSSSLPFLHITSLQIPPQFHLFGSCVFFIVLLPSTASLYRILNSLFFGFYPHNQRSSISLLQLNRCCSESSARCLLVVYKTFILLYSREIPEIIRHHGTFFFLFLLCGVVQSVRDP